ncbi:rCG33221, isoform CRA_e [Rattus norvegicus]|uniref:RCG33221, isoform CRA_e n=1 Tax=Rattus norvegicus TaxID=10116 RepID=A6HG41_RAT|nr:rCG33221, isoform CRA_e [Rattus norvegicus]
MILGKTSRSQSALAWRLIHRTCILDALNGLHFPAHSPPSGTALRTYTTCTSKSATTVSSPRASTSSSGASPSAKFVSISARNTWCARAQSDSPHSPPYLKTPQSICSTHLVSFGTVTLARRHPWPCKTAAQPLEGTGGDRALS